MSDWNAEEYERRFSFVPDYGRDVLKLLEGDRLRVLDLGCGNGTLTKAIADMGHDVVGMDSSDSQLELASRTYPSLNFVKGDATDFFFKEKFDAVFSNAALHWIDADRQPDMMLCVRDCLNKGGQFVFEMGGFGNNQLIHAQLERQFKARGYEYEIPFYFPTAGQYSAMLEGTGLLVTYASLFKRPTPVDGYDGLVQWLKMFVRRPFEGVDDDIAEEIRHDAAEALKAQFFHDGKWYLDYVRLRMRAVNL